MRGNARQCAAMRGNARQCAAMRGNARQGAAAHRRSERLVFAEHLGDPATLSGGCRVGDHRRHRRVRLRLLAG
jgi:hypothetical protein